MASNSATFNNWTPVAVADTAAMTAQGFLAIQGGSSTQRINVKDIYMGGLAAAAAPAQMLLARDTTAFSGATSNAALLTLMDPSSAALAAPPLVQSVGSTTLPQRSATAKFLTLSFNAFGGIVRMSLPPDEYIGILGNTQPLGEISLSSASTGTPGLMSSTIIIEPL